MAAPTVHAAPKELRSERNPVVVMALRSVLSITSTLAARWEDLDPEFRRHQVEELLEVAVALARLVDEQDPGDPADWDPPFDGLSLLTPRETEILRALEAGGSTTGIARALGIGAATVRSHVKSILSKLDVHSRVEAIAVAARSLGVPRTGPNGS